MLLLLRNTVDDPDAARTHLLMAAAEGATSRYASERFADSFPLCKSNKWELFNDGWSIWIHSNQIKYPILQTEYWNIWILVVVLIVVASKASKENQTRGREFDENVPQVEWTANGIWDEVAVLCERHEYFVLDAYPVRWSMSVRNIMKMHSDSLDYKQILPENNNSFPHWVLWP